MKHAPKIVYWLACLTVAVLSLMPLQYLPPAAFDWWDKAQHALGSFVLGIFGLIAYAATPLRVLISLLLFGSLIELLQSASGWRYGDWYDWLANAAGLSLAYLVYRLAIRRMDYDPG